MWPFDNLNLDSFGAAGMPWTKSTSKNLPFQDALFNAFSNRQSIFSPSPKASGSPDAQSRIPFFQELGGGGLAWSYDPGWMTGLPKANPLMERGFAEILAEAGGKRRNRTENIYDSDPNPNFKMPPGLVLYPEIPFPAPIGYEWVKGVGGYYLREIGPRTRLPKGYPNDPNDPSGNDRDI